MKGKEPKGKMKHHAEKKHEEKTEKKEHFKKGGAVHKAEGHKPKHRMDKRARGGKIMTPSSPLSGAEPKGLPGGGKAQSKPDKECD